MAANDDKGREARAALEAEYPLLVPLTAALEQLELAGAAARAMGPSIVRTRASRLLSEARQRLEQLERTCQAAGRFEHRVTTVLDAITLPAGLGKGARRGRN